MRPVQPGRILKDEIEARGLSANALALGLRTPSGRITDILTFRPRPRSGSPAIRVGARFWLKLQTAREIAPTEATTAAGCELVRT